jgi:hypothetical protein
MGLEMLGERSLRPVKKQRSRKSISRDGHLKPKNEENGTQDSTPYPTLLLSKGKNPMETTVEKNFHSNQPDDDISRQANKSSLFETLVQVCHLECLKESPGHVDTVVEGTSSQSSATENEALKLFKILIDEMPKTPKRRSINNISVYIQNKLTHEGGVDQITNEIRKQIFEASVKIADEILFHQNLNPSSEDILRSLHLTEPESSSNNIRRFGSKKKIYQKNNQKCPNLHSPFYFTHELSSGSISGGQSDS